ncbi:MAG: TraB/GumN family protein [Gloeobacteraceae cyanobacterium ES-bin-316]|nr:TraB/GumN family protein [Ferruginibacter sp.]
MKATLFLPLLFFVQCCSAQPSLNLPANPDNNSLLWEISGKDLKKPSYLFGTFHMMCKADIQFSKNLLAALKNSEEVYFEMDLDDPSNTLGALFFMNMKDGKTLKDLYTAEEYNKLLLFFKDSLRTSLGSFQKMKPSFLEAFLYPKLMPCKNLSGVEQELLKIAAIEKKEIKGFETIAFQAAFFDSIPYSAQAKSLLNSIDSIENYKKYFEKMVDVYQSQKLDSIESLFNEEEFGLKDGLELLLDKRNINWVAQLKTILPSKNIFMAVGAAHLVGQKGVIELLKKEGYTLTPILNK